jgi:hypothetical protein
MSCPLSSLCKICPDDEKKNAPPDYTSDYYDDEELDRYVGISPDDLGEGALNEFREVLNTLIPKEIPLWLQSLDRRHLRLPPSLLHEAQQLMESGKV